MHLRLGLQRAVKQIFDNGSTREFPSLAETQRITGIGKTNIGIVCREHRIHARLTNKGGYHWEYDT